MRKLTLCQQIIQRTRASSECKEKEAAALKQFVKDKESCKDPLPEWKTFDDIVENILK